MKQADKAAVKRVRNATTQSFAQHVFWAQGQHKVPWRNAWMGVRLRCPKCEGYLRPLKTGGPQCVDCGQNGLERKAFWVEKAKIVLHLVLGEDHGELWPYFITEKQAA